MSAATHQQQQRRSCAMRQHADPVDGDLQRGRVRRARWCRPVRSNSNTTYTVTVRGGATTAREGRGGQLAARQRRPGRSPPAAAGGPCAAECDHRGELPDRQSVERVGHHRLPATRASRASPRRSASTAAAPSSSRWTPTRLTTASTSTAWVTTAAAARARSPRVNPSASLPQTSRTASTQASTGLIDCGNWAVSGSWAVPADATSGIYFAKVVRDRHRRRQPHRVHRAQRCQHLATSCSRRRTRPGRRTTTTAATASTRARRAPTRAAPTR